MKITAAINQTNPIVLFIMPSSTQQTPNSQSELSLLSQLCHNYEQQTNLLDHFAVLLDLQLV